MRVIDFGQTNSILNQYISEIRNVEVQNDRLRFRRNIERIGEIMAYEAEQDTDFIFCTVGEEEGFVGSTAVLLLFLILILRLIVVAERQQSPFGRVYGYSVLSIFLFHLFINIGMVLGLTPVIGIPLPFFSYGGSSLWGFTILLFIFLRIDAGRNRRI